MKEFDGGEIIYRMLTMRRNVRNTLIEIGENTAKELPLRRAGASVQYRAGV